MIRDKKEQSRALTLKAQFGFSIREDLSVTRTASDSIVRQLESLYDGRSVVGLSDRLLLERFITLTDRAAEESFAALVARHGPMVLETCRDVLADRHDAEDAFQAVFLILARNARSLREPDLLSYWLHGVALRTARKARTRIARRRDRPSDSVVDARREEPVDDGAQPAEKIAIRREAAETLHHEIERLPRAFRLPVLLCHFEGLSLDEAARRLAWPPGTLRSRLARARSKLRAALVRRGWGESAAALCAISSPHRFNPPPISPRLCAQTARAALGFASRTVCNLPMSSATAAIAHDVLISSFRGRLKIAGLALLMTAAFALTARYQAVRAAAHASPSNLHSLATLAQITPPVVAEGQPRPPLAISGRVLDPDGKPAPGAAVMVYAALKQSGDRALHGFDGPRIIATASTDRAGRFTLATPSITSTTHHLAGASALLPGFGEGWTDLDIDTQTPAIEISLKPEQVIEGRLFDVAGQPARDVVISVNAVGYPERTPNATSDAIEGGPFFWGRNDPMPTSAWPGPARSDSDGRFTIRGIGRNCRASLLVRDPRFARQHIVVDTDSPAQSKSFNVALEPAKVVTGRVTFADTGQPVPHAQISIGAVRETRGTIMSYHETDEDGRFTAIPFSGRAYSVHAQAPPGQPYLSASTGFLPWPKGSSTLTVNLAHKRAGLIRGKVTEVGTGAPVAGASVGFIERDSGNSNPIGRAQTAADGTFQFAAAPALGTIAVLGPSDEFVFERMAPRELGAERLGNRRHYAHAFVPCELRPGVGFCEVNASIRRGATIAATVSGPDGQPVAHASIFSRLHLLPQPFVTRRYWGNYHGDVRDGRCALYGVAHDDTVPVYFLDPKNQWGAVSDFSVKRAAGGPIAVRLEPCGRAAARVVDRRGQPLAGYRDPHMIVMDITPRPKPTDRAATDIERGRAESDFYSRMNPEHYRDLAADNTGRIIFPALVPGAHFRVIDRTTDDDADDSDVRAAFIARAGETIELGDIVVHNPP